MEKTFWLSFDLGLTSDRDGLFKWLDEIEAEECGFGVAVFRYIPQTSDPVTEVRDLILKQVKLEKRDRLYLIWKDDEPPHAAKGKFIFGSRRGAPWKGYALKSEEVDM